MFSALSGDVPLVGRSTLLAAIEETLGQDDVYGAFIYGDTGTGKSVMARHLLKHLQGQFAPFLVTPASALGAIPYGALGPFLTDATAEDMASPLSVLRMVMSFLRGRANGRPILVIVDDAHLLDDDSSHLLAQLVTSRTVRLAVFSRSVTPVSDELVSLCRDGLLERYDVAPLGYVDARELCTQVLGAGIVRGASDRLCDEASGNPLFLKAILDEALMNGSLTKPEGVWTLADGELNVPAALIDLVRAVTMELDDLQRKAFDVLALGEVVAFADLVSVSSEEAVFTLLSEGLIQSAPDNPAFAMHMHDLYGRIARKLIPVGRSNALHRELRSKSHRLPLPPRAQIRHALWSLDCGEPVVDEQLLELAGLALTLLDPRSALRLASAVRAERLATGAQVDRANALFDLSRLEESRNLSKGLLEQGRTPGLISAAGVLEVRQLLAAGEDVAGTEDIVARWSDALNALEPSSPESSTSSQAEDSAPGPLSGGTFAEDLPTSEQHRVVTQGFGWNLIGRYAETVEILRPLVAAGSSNQRVMVLAHAFLAEALGALGRGSEGREHSATALTLAESHAQPMLDLHRLVFFRHVSLLVHSGDFLAAQQAVDEYAPGVGRDYSFISGSLAVLDAATDIRRGHFSSGLGKLRPALASLRVSDQDALLPYALGVTAWAAAAVGQPDLVALCSAELAHIKHRGSRQYSLLGRAFDDAAQTLLLRGARDSSLLEFAAEAHGNGWFSCEKDILELATELGNEQSPELLARVSGALEGAEADVLHAYASALVAHDAAGLAEAGDRAELFQKYLLATDACRRAMEAYAELGDARSQRALAAVVRRRRGMIDGGLLVEPVELEGASPLTSREREIALLALRGLSNKEIARSLTVSTRTVEGHLYRIYVKLGIGRREELAAELEPLLRGT
ncbi:helix-turn-helix transcriptional regulator [Arthrobacter sp. MDT2-2]